MADSQKYKPLLSNNPLCGISTYKDTLNLATGACTRQIKKVDLSTLTWTWNAGSKLYSTRELTDIVYTSSNQELGVGLCEYYKLHIGSGMSNASADGCLAIDTSMISVHSETQTPPHGNFYYVLTTPTTETVIVPTGLSGIEEGYLIQSETPTPTNPIYPTANNVEIWQHSLRKLTTATEAVENPLYSDGTAITSYTIKGDTVQNGTPTPSNPVEVNGVGDKTANLYDYKSVAIGKYINASGQEATSTGTGDNILNHTDYISVTSGENYYFKIRKTYDAGATSNAFCWFDSNKDLINRDVFDIGNSNYIYNTYTAPQNAAYLIVNFRGEYYDTGMLNIGNTAIDFEPYGYKLDISSGGENLFDYSDLETGSINPIDGSNMNSPNQKRTKSYMSVIGGESYCVSNLPPDGGIRVHQYKQDKTYLGSNVYSSVFTTDATCAYVRIAGGSGNFNPNIMLNTGSTPLPYEPYNRTTTPVYLGSTQTVRQVKKLVLTGNENGWIKNTDTSNPWFQNDSFAKAIPRAQGLCTHFVYTTISGTTTDIGWYITQQNNQFRFRPANASDMSLQDFKDWLAINKPIIYFVLATPQTAAVNEPLMKIGTYTDTLSNATSIPTTEGANNITVDTTVQPSEFTATYTGWHDASVKEYVSGSSIADLESMSISQMENLTIQELQGGNWV